MNNWRSNQSRVFRKGLTGCLLILLLISVLIVSVTARYMTTGRTTATFTPVLQNNSLYVFAGRDANGIGKPLEMANTAMQFLCISNAQTQESFEDCEDMTFRIRLYLQQTSEITEAPYLILQTGSEPGEWDGQEMIAQPRYLDDDSALAKISGSGWIYTFEDVTGKEMLFTLSGSEFSNQYFVLRTNGGVFSQFQLKVELVRTESEVTQ